jgi:hypothetical protein
MATAASRSSSCSSSRRRRLPVGAAVAVAIALALAGCGKTASPQRAALASYIKQVDRIERALAVPLARVTTAGDEFSAARRAQSPARAHVPSYAAQQRQLVRARQQMLALGHELAATPSPVAARRLRTMLLALIDGQARTTRQLALLVGFLPRFDTVLARVVPVTQALNAALTKAAPHTRKGLAAGNAAKVAALRRFEDQVSSVVRELRPLAPPAASAPTYQAQIRSLVGMSYYAGQIAKTLAAGKLSRLRPELLAYDRAATSSQSLAVQKAQRAAVVAYDEQTASFETLKTRIQSELQRVEATLA